MCTLILLKLSDIRNPTRKIKTLLSIIFEPYRYYRLPLICYYRHVKRPLFLLDFTESVFCLRILVKPTQCKVSRKFIQRESICLFHEDGRMDISDGVDYF